MSSEDTGRLVGGRYRLGDVLGRGGMGTVWRGEDEILSRPVAVKELRFPNSVDDEEKQRLVTRTLREAKAIARIRSGSAITVFDVVDEDGRPWIVMELVEGRSLADQLKADGPLSPRRAAQVGLAVLDVLRAAHREGILHRDVKPSNVLLEDGTDRVVLTDFGIAKVEGDPSVTSTGMLVGAPSYISPERARGKPPGPPADLWSLGGLLYAAVEGHPPYDKGSAISTLTAVMTEPVPESEHAGELAEAIAGLLVKDPEKRLGVDSVRELLEPVAHGTAAVPEVPDATRTVAVPPAPEDAASSSPEDSDGDSDGDSDRADNPGAGGLAGGGEDAKAGPKSGAVATYRAGAKSGPKPGAGTGATSVAKSGPGAPAGAKGAAAARGSQAALPREAAAQRVASEGAAAAGSSASRTDVQGTGGEPDAAGGARRAALPGALLARFSRRTLAILAVVIVVLVVAAVVLVTTASGGSERDNAGQQTGSSAGTADKGGSEGAGSGKADTSPSEAADGAADRDKGDSKGEGKDEGGSADDRGGDGGSKAEESKLPNGFTGVADDRFGFRMGMPDGWTRTGVAGQNSGAKYGSSNGSLPKVQVDHNSSPQPDAAKTWRQLEPAVRGSSTGYHLIGIDKVGWRGYPTVADWKFTRKENGQRVRVLNRGFRVDGSHGYAIMITCKASEWDGKECRQLRDTAFKTFKPTG